MSSLNIPLLKYLYEEIERIDEKIEGCLRSEIYTDVVGLRGNFLTKNNISKVIEEVLERSEKSWFDFVIALESDSLSRNVFIFGEKSIIYSSLEQISDFAFHSKSFMEYCLWVGSNLKDKPSIKELIH